MKLIDCITYLMFQTPQLKDVNISTPLQNPSILGATIICSLSNPEFCPDKKDLTWYLVSLMTLLLNYLLSNLSKKLPFGGLGGSVQNWASTHSEGHFGTEKTDLSQRTSICQLESGSASMGSICLTSSMHLGCDSVVL